MYAFEQAQMRSFDLLNNFCDCLTEGMSAKDARVRLEELRISYGFSGWLNQPTILFQSRKKRIFPKLQIIEKGTLIAIHIQPTTEDAFGSVGRSFAFDEPDPPIVQKAKDLSIASCTFANHFKCVGEIFVFAHSWSINHRLELADAQRIGHRCFARKDIPLWPHSAYLFTKLRRHQIQWYNPQKTEGIYAIHPGIKADGRIAVFGEMISIVGDQKKILGRS